jgi:hypothetical protein
MAELIRFMKGDVLVEVARPDATLPVAGTGADKVEASFEAAVKRLEPVLAPVVTAVQGSIARSGVKQAEVTLAFSFTAEGNLFLTKATAEANLEVKLTFEAKP